MLAIEKQSTTGRDQALVLWYEEVGMADIALVGGKNASLGELIQQLTPQGINVPQGFATTAYAYQHFVAKAGLDSQLRQLFADLDVDDVENLQWHGLQARSLILNTSFPQDLQTAIIHAYTRLCQMYGSDTDVAVRSSATAEDLPDASFAGQQETYLNIHGLKEVLAACHRCFASLFTDRAISYRTTKGFDHFEVALSVGVQKMVRSDLATSGVMFSIDTESGFRDAALITAAYGLGETVVQGAVNPDEYLVFKPTLAEGFRPILSKRLGSKETKMVYDEGGSKLTRTVSVPEGDRHQFALSDDEVLQLAQWACLIEHHYSQLRGTDTPMDIEWAKDGHTRQLFIVQARPETVQSQKSQTILRTYRLLPAEGRGIQQNSDVNVADSADRMPRPDNSPPTSHLRPSASICVPYPLLSGRAVGEMIGQGKVRIVMDVRNLSSFQSGSVLVTARTDPDWEPVMKKASAIITNQGGRTCHAAIIARELGIPAIVGCGNATEVLQTGQEVTVSCAEGDEGHVYDGLLPFEVEETPLDNLPRTQTQILMNVGNPEEAFRLAAIPCDGVGLARFEFIIANHIKVHPLALLHFEELPEGNTKQAIATLTAAYDHKPDYFVDKLAQGVATLAAAFYPRPVIARMSDFKSNEYANLLGGDRFEPTEENPMIGWRGASRYYDPRYRDAFGLECRAIRRVRDEMGLTNLIPMIPFCRTPEEGQKVLEEMARHGLVRGEKGLQVYVMCELPSNVMLADEFSQVFDGFSIGSNDLTQLTLGLDRDSELVAPLFDERNRAVKRMVQTVIERAKANGRKIGICGQAPSDYPEFAEFLVSLEIDSISLNPDSVLRTLLDVARMEGTR